MTFSNSSTSRTNIFISSAMLDCSVTSLCHVTKSTGATFFVIQENLERSRGCRHCIKECSTAVSQATGALLNATRFRLRSSLTCLQNTNIWQWTVLIKCWRLLPPETRRSSRLAERRLNSAFSSDRTCVTPGLCRRGIHEDPAPPGPPPPPPLPSFLSCAAQNVLKERNINATDKVRDGFLLWGAKFLKRLKIFLSSP